MHEVDKRKEIIDEFAIALLAASHSVSEPGLLGHLDDLIDKFKDDMSESFIREVRECNE